MVEKRRVAGGHVLQGQVLYLGELNGRQEAAWRKTVEIFGQDPGQPSQVALFDERYAPAVSSAEEVPVVAIQLSKMRLLRPRQWGACWLECELWSQLGLDAFWLEKLPLGRQGARWDKILQVLTLYRLIGPGSEWRLHCQWFQQSALADLLAFFGYAVLERYDIAMVSGMSSPVAKMSKVIERAPRRYRGRELRKRGDKAHPANRPSTGP